MRTKGSNLFSADWFSYSFGSASAFGLASTEAEKFGVTGEKIDTIDIRKRPSALSTKAEVVATDPWPRVPTSYYRSSTCR